MAYIHKQTVIPRKAEILKIKIELLKLARRNAIKTNYIKITIDQILEITYADHVINWNIKNENK